MTPSKVWVFYPHDEGAPVLWTKPCPFPHEDEAECVEYVRLEARESGEGLVERLHSRAKTMNGASPVGAGDGETHTMGYYDTACARDDLAAADALAAQQQQLAAKDAEIDRMRIELDAADKSDVSARDLLNDTEAEIERLREALKTTESWLERWAQHVGRCRGGAQCECGLEAVRHDARTALRKDTP